MFYRPEKDVWFFEKGRLYSEFNWSNFREIVVAWERRVKGWYIEPIEVLLNRDLSGWRSWIVRWVSKRDNPGHFAFTVMATSCLLIDALSQYRYGEFCSSGRLFKDFVKDFLPTYAGRLPCPIWHYDHKYSQTGTKLDTYAEVLWNGYRCGILHQAHAPMYCGIVPGKTAPTFEPANQTKYGPSATNPNSVPGTDCPVITVRPENLFDEVKLFFDGYVRDLLDPNPNHDGPKGVRTLFKQKFSDSFGESIASATL